jgi:hypothetical protein
VQTTAALLNCPERGKAAILEHAVVAVGRMVAERAQRLQAAPGLAPPGASSMDHLRLPYYSPF